MRSSSNCPQPQILRSGARALQVAASFKRSAQSSRQCNGLQQTLSRYKPGCQYPSIFRPHWQRHILLGLRSGCLLGSLLAVHSAWLPLLPASCAVTGKAANHTSSQDSIAAKTDLCCMGNALGDAAGMQLQMLMLMLLLHHCNQPLAADPLVRPTCGSCGSRHQQSAPAAGQCLHHTCPAFNPRCSIGRCWRTTNGCRRRRSSSSVQCSKHTAACPDTPVTGGSVSPAAAHSLQASPGP